MSDSRFCVGLVVLLAFAVNGIAFADITPDTIDADRHQSSDSSSVPSGGAALAQSSSEQYRITKQTIDNGGEHAISNQFVINGTVGQPDASAARASVGYRLSGGFWANSNGVIVPPGDQIFADGFESQ